MYLNFVILFPQGGPAFTAVINVGIEADPSFNLIGRIRGPNVSPGALCLIVSRSMSTHVLYLEPLYFISKDFWRALLSIFCMVAGMLLSFHTCVVLPLVAIALLLISYWNSCAFYDIVTDAYHQHLIRSSKMHHSVRI